MIYLLVFVSCVCSLGSISLLALKKSKANSLTVVFGIIGIVVSFLALSYSAPRNPERLGIDYLGFIVAIIALIATLLLGMQLYHVFRLKEDAEEVMKAKQHIDEYGQKMRLLMEQTDSLDEKMKELYQEKENIAADVKALSEALTFE